MRAALSFLLPATVCAQPPMAVSTLAWMEGTWLGSADGVHQEETWSAVAQGQIQGMYRELRDGKLLSMELLTLTQAPDGLWLTMRHFDSAMQPWTKEMESPLRWKVSVAEMNHARFELPTGGSLEYWREGNLMRAELIVPRPNGKVHHETFAFRRKF
jgi:hypothetical protein